MKSLCDYGNEHHLQIALRFIDFLMAVLPIQDKLCLCQDKQASRTPAFSSKPNATALQS